MKSIRLVMLLLCCIVSWACNSVLGTDEFKKSGCIEGEVRCAGDRPERCSSGSWQTDGPCNGQTCIGGACVGECAPGGKRCDEQQPQQPQRCDELSGNWTNDGDPCTNATCSDGACVGICAPGQTSCSSNNTPQTCDAKGQWKNAAAACDQQTCIDGACVGECAPGKKQCNGQQPQRCDELSGNWTNDGDPCTNATCSDGVCVGICAPGQTSCSTDNTPQICDVNGQWANAESACDHQTCIDGACVGECAPGKRCLGNTPQTCSTGSWQSETPCTSGETCNGGSCTCINGDLRCYANTPQKCVDAQWQNIQAPCENTSQTCDPLTITCVGVCAPGERCSGTTLQACNLLGQWVDTMTCPYTCVDGNCAECEQGQQYCNGQHAVICDVTGQWFDLGPCFGQTCVNGVCQGECEPGKRCRGDMVETCSPFGTWGSEKLCSSGEVCNGGSCTCINGDLRCYANTPQQCIGAQWQNIQAPCESANQTCHPVLVTCMGECAPGKRCTGTDLQTCNMYGEWVLAMPCAYACLGEHCTECAPGALQCSGNTPQECNAQGQWQDVAPGACVGQTCFAGACVGVCELGSKRCAGSETQQVCDILGDWIPVGECFSPQHCSGGECVVGEVECSTGDVRCVWNTPQTCVGPGAWMYTGGCTPQQSCLNGSCVGVCGPWDVGCSGLVPRSCDVDGQWKDHPACTGAGGCVNGSCPGPSCDGLAPNCGPLQNENCCTSPVVTGGTYNRTNDSNAPATVSDFRLDRFEVTVGRFRKFVEAYPGSKPMAGAGAHPLLGGSGWFSGWDTILPTDQAALKTLVNCDPNYQTWTDAAGANENLPMNCINWYVSFAFCAWDGGRLATEAEWNYAAAGGNEQRQYPWSNPPGSTAISSFNAVYECNGQVGPNCNMINVLNVGSTMGDGRWRQADMGGSMWEWNLDWYSSIFNTQCNDCAELYMLGGFVRVLRGGGWNSDASSLLSSYRSNFFPEYSSYNIGARCARTP